MVMNEIKNENSTQAMGWANMHPQDYALKIFLNSITIVSYPFPKNVDLYLDWWAKWKHFPNTLLYSKSFYWRALEILKGFVLWRANQSDPLHKKEKKKTFIVTVHIAVGVIGWKRSEKRKDRTNSVEHQICC